MKENIISVNKKRKILMVCYACAPNRGSEPGVGWNFLTQITPYHQVHVIVEIGFQKEIQEYIKDKQEYNSVTFHYIKREHHHFLRKIWPPSYYWYYRHWQKKVYDYVKELDKKENFDLIHQITLAGYREPGYLWKLNKPFIWGPLGGLNQTSWKLLPMLGLHGMIFFGMRNILNSWQKRFSKIVRNAASNAHTIFVSDKHGVVTTTQIWKRIPKYMCEVGCSHIQDISQLLKHQPKTPLRVCWAGLFVPLKALQLLLRALTLVKQPIHVEILGGGGTMKNKWQSLAQKLHITDKVTFHGIVPRDKVLQVMSTCHVMCITSIHEGGTGTVTLEALQNGLPIIALDHCAFSEVITDSCGIKIPIISKKQIIRDFARHLDTLAQDEELRYSLSQGALKRAQDFTWSSKIKQINKIYEEAILK